MVALLVVLTVALAALAGTLAAWGLGLRRRTEQLSRELPALQDQLIHTERLRAIIESNPDAAARMREFVARYDRPEG